MLDLKILHDIFMFRGKDHNLELEKFNVKPTYPAKIAGTVSLIWFSIS